MAAPMRLSTTCLSAGAWCRSGWNAPACSARGSSDLLDAARETADYPALEALFKKSLEELYGQMAGQVKKNEHKDIQKVTDYIAAHYRENLTLEVLAKHIHMNPFYFSSYFKKQLGQNFKDYLNPDSVKVLQGAKLEESLKDAKPGDRFQFVRNGYFTPDSKHEGVYNRIVTLKDSFKL